MKKIIVAFLFILFNSFLFAQSERISVNWCGTGKSQDDGGSQDDLYRGRFQDFSNLTRLNNQNGLIIIPVVFHVVWNTGLENISDAVIQSQLARLNTDFRKLNNDISNTPPEWQGITADINIEFRLACIDPQGQFTTGITRDFTSNPDFMTPDAVKSVVPAWPTDTYLNIWTCDINDLTGTLGEAKYPWQYATTPNLDGIVLDYTITGENNGHPRKNLGRVLNHEVGHWLGLHHFFAGFVFCSLDVDFVADTPTSDDTGFGGICPSGYLFDVCSPVIPGAMYMNYMQLTNDPCMYMFTQGQRTRMRGYIDAPGPSSRYPFLANYFGIKRFLSLPLNITNNQIIINLSNPACINVVINNLTGPVTLASLSNQQIILNVNSCVNSGIVSLTVSGANYVDDYTFSFTNMAGCCAGGVWPKLYYSKHPEAMTKDYFGNLFVFWHYSSMTEPMVNHQGVLPPSPPYYGQYTFHYTNAGVTNWTQTHNGNEYTFPLGNGNVQIHNDLGGPFPTSYYNGTTGNLTSPPANIPANEIILGESFDGSYVTRKFDGNNSDIVSAYFSNGLNTSISLPFYAGRSTYDQSSKTLYLHPSNPNNYTYRVFRMTGNSFNLILSQSRSGYAPVTVDNQGNLYTVENGAIMKYDALTGASLPFSINGFNNSTIKSMRSGNPYTSNYGMVLNESENMIYHIDFSAGTFKRINLSSSSDFDYAFFYYVYEGSCVYLSGVTRSPSAQIGNQSIPEMPNPLTINSTSFLTKFDLNGDFFRSSAFAPSSPIFPQHPFSIRLIPNPAISIVRVEINEKLPEKNNHYSIRILDAMLNPVLARDNYLNLSTLEIDKVKPGLYFIEVSNSNQQRVIQTIRIK